MTDNSGENLWEKVKENYPLTGEMKMGPYFQEQLLSGHILFTLARYKSASRLLEGKNATVLELGCNEGIGSLYLARVASKVVSVDFDNKGIEWAKNNLENKMAENLTFIYDNFLGKKYGSFDAAVSIDVIEHIHPKDEETMLQTILDNLKPSGFAIIGTPNKTASKYASKLSEIGHINLFDEDRLRETLSKKFVNVFTFGLNDEIAHFGYKHMRHYLMALACGKK